MAKKATRKPKLSSRTKSKVITYNTMDIKNQFKDKTKIVVNVEAAEKASIERAEAEIEQLSQHFEEWFDKDIKKLVDAKTEIVKNGLNSDTRRALYLAAHEIKGIGGSFNYPLASKVAYSLCHLLEEVTDNDRIPLKVIDQHVNAIVAMVNQKAQGKGSIIAFTLVNKLSTVTENYIQDIQNNYASA